MNPTGPPSKPTLPFPVFQVSPHVERYMLYDIDTITWLRQAHNILGVLIATLSQSPQQNVFLGLPLELQPEEARLLVDKRLAFIVNDLNWHKRDWESKNPDQVESMRTDAYKKGMDIAKVFQNNRQTRTHKALKKIRDQEDLVGEKHLNATPVSKTVDDTSEDYASEDALFGESLRRESTATAMPSLLKPDDSDLIPWTTTSTTSCPPLTPPADTPPRMIPKVDASSYALFAHLHSKGYFMSPGIRFGCQFAVYPGDPLRFHSHFLSMSYDWDEEIDLLELVGGGRLGTGVKKGWLIGGPEEVDGRDEDDESKRNVRTFCIEWGGM